MTTLIEQIKIKIQQELTSRGNEPEVIEDMPEIKKGLIEPYATMCFDSDTNGESSFYVVFKESQTPKEIAQFWIVYSPEREMFGLALFSLKNKTPQFIGFDGAFLDAFFGR